VAGLAAEIGARASEQALSCVVICNPTRPPRASHAGGRLSRQLVGVGRPRFVVEMTGKVVEGIVRVFDVEEVRPRILKALERQLTMSSPSVERLTVTLKQDATLG
jgi:hypothetical protein